MKTYHSPTTCILTEQAVRHVHLGWPFQTPGGSTGGSTSPHGISSRPSYMWFEKDFLWEKVWTIVCVFCLLNNIVPLTIRDATLTALIKDNNYLSKAIDLFNI